MISTTGEAAALALPSRSPWALVACGVVLLVACLMSLGIGAMAIPPSQVLSILAETIGLGGSGFADERSHAVLLAIRVPRLLLGAVGGAGLAVAGVAMQALFRNPLADPGIVGVSSGAALAAASLIVFGGAEAAQPSGWTLGLLPVAAFLGGVVTTAAVYRVSTRSGRTSVRQLLLAGIAINALAGAATGLLVFVASDAQLRSLTFWSLGSLGGATWPALAATLPWMLPPLLLFPRLAPAMNALLLGEADAGYLGFDADKLKRVVVALSALAVGSTVAITGVIGFVGLVVPHLARLLLGPDHHRLIPGAALLGAALLLAADVCARTIAAPAEIPIGILTALIGAPCLLWLMGGGRRGAAA